MRLISYIAISVVLGGIFFLLGTDVPRKALNRAVVLASSILGLCTVLLFLLHGLNASGGSWSQIANLGIMRDVLTTQVGEALFARIVVVVETVEYVLIAFDIEAFDAAVVLCAL